MKFAVLFPGQGSQKVGMGLDLFNESNTAKEIFKKVNSIVGRKISDICFNGTENELNKTENTQISILTVSIVLTILLLERLNTRKLPFNPYGLCGHSLGEFTALWFTGFFTLEQVIKLVSIRGSLMQNAPQGGMAAVLNLEENKIKELIENNNELKNKLVIANYNTPKQIVISGEKVAIEKSIEIIKANGGKTIILPVSGAFHSPLMAEASKLFTSEIDKLVIQNNIKIKFPIFQNVDGKESQDPTIIIEKVKKQMTSPVYWTQTINNLVKKNVTDYIEIGPGKVLVGLVKKINPNVSCYNICDLASLNEFIELYEPQILQREPQKTT